MTRLLGSLALIVGGLAWMVQGVLLAGKTYGDTAGVRLLRPAEPLSSTYRNTDDLALYVGAAVVLTLVGLALLHGRAIWNAGGWGKASVVLLALGVLLLAPWPLLGIGYLSFILGMIALGITALRTGVLPRSVAGMLIAAAILLLFANVEDDRALLLAGPGAAWIWLGARSLVATTHPQPRALGSH